MVAYPPQNSSRSDNRCEIIYSTGACCQDDKQPRCLVVFAVDRRKALGLIVNCSGQESRPRPNEEGETMAKLGYKILDSDMHVFEPHDLYLKYMNPKWGDRIPRGQPR